MHRLVRPLATLLVAGALVQAAPVEAKDAYKDVKKLYDQGMVRAPLNIRRAVMERLARTGNPRAITILGARYGKPRSPKDHEQYLIASTIGTHFQVDPHVKGLRILAKRYPKPRDAWLWYQCYRGIATAGNLPEMKRVIESDDESMLRRSVALDALSLRLPKHALKLAPALLDEDWPKTLRTQLALTRAAARALERSIDKADRPDVLAVAERLVALFKREDVGADVGLAVARHLTRAYKVSAVTTDHAFWTRRVQFDESKQTGPTVETRPRFFGLEATGTRIAFLLDLSDSMCQPVSAREVRDARATASQTSGHPIDWAKIRNRFDLARACLIDTLRTLDADKQFVLVGFGTEAALFRSTRGLVPASGGAINAAIAELQRIRPGKAKKDRPHGTLRGNTNLHGALLRAFRAVRGKSLRGSEHLDPQAISQGCDTVYVFSDGRPTDDDFDAEDSTEAGAVIVDRESGKTAQIGGGRVTYFGPYQLRGPLLEDVRRLTSVRSVEIHTVAIGEADVSLLKEMTSRAGGHHRALPAAK